jgi:hypothetical protein
MREVGKVKAKIICNLVMTLLMTTTIPAIGKMNIENSDSVLSDPKCSTTDVIWSDNFDSYTLGQFLDGTPDDGGWKGWDNDPAFGAYVVDDQALSSPHSVDIVGAADLLHVFTGICSGQWTLTFWNYVPTDFLDASYFYMMSYYRDLVPYSLLRAQLSIEFNGLSGNVWSRFFGQTTPLIKGQWVEIRIEIDLDTDWLECYYNDELIDAKNWTAGVHNTHNGYFNLNTVAMWASDSDSVYYDDFTLEGEAGPIPELVCEGELFWDNVKTSETVTGSFTVKNNGDPNSVLDWEIIEWPEGWNTTWTFYPENGRLKPEDGPATVEVTVEAPDKTNSEFTGEIKLCAIYDPEEFCTIPVGLITPKTKSINRPILNWLQSHPYMFPLLQKLIQLGFGL